MARRRRRRHYRGLGDYISVPSLSGLKLPKVRELNPFGKHVNTTDLAIGAVGAMAGGAFVKMGLNKLNELAGGKIPAFIMNYVAPISTLLAGILLGKFVAKGRKYPAFYAGAVVAAGVPFAWQLLKDTFPTYFADYISVPSVGLLVDDAGMSGLLVDDPSMAELAAYSMNEGDSDEILPDAA